MVERIRREIEGLHAFFERWFRGEVPDTPEGFARCLDVLRPAFRLVTPSGTVLTRSLVAAQVRAAHGSRAAPRDPLRIRVARLDSRALEDGTWLACYEEWHHEGERRRGRQSSAVLCAQRGTPNGLAWEHVHETWLLPPAGGSNVGAPAGES